VHKNIIRTPFISNLDNCRSIAIESYNDGFPDPIGVLYSIEDATYEDMMMNQINEATKKKDKVTIQDIINAGDTWVVK
jgi:hypothetical protein